MCVQPSLHGVKFGSGEALPNGVVICLSMMIGRLEKCQLEDVLRLTSNFRHFTRASTMSVSGITATNLEFFNNQVRHSLHRTSTTTRTIAHAHAPPHTHTHHRTRTTAHAHVTVLTLGALL
jgi:hypothetical protein